MTDSKRFHLITLGCAKNTVDSEAMHSLLTEAGHAAVGRLEEADLVVVHTCGFIESAKQESIDALLGALARRSPGQRVVAAGCLAERYPDELGAELPGLDGPSGP